jgi:5-methylcytosine-specific restriction endonuclease McrA
MTDMHNIPPVPAHISDPDLIAEVMRLAASERKAIAALVSALAELDSRRLYLGQGCSSMFTYGTQVLRLSEHAAFNRIEAARAARRFPVVLELLADGRIHLSAVRLLAPHLTEANHDSVLRDASHKSKREVEQIVARLLPRPDAPSIVRKLPQKPAPEIMRPAAAIHTAPIRLDVAPSVASAAASRPKTDPLAPGRFKVQFTMGEETYRKLLRVQDLLRHRLPNGDLDEVFDRALTLLLSHLEKSKIAATKRPRVAAAPAKYSRHVPSQVRRAVWARDGGRCRFEGPAGRCTETGLLEFHHVTPYARRGPTTVDNLELRCAAHNRYEAEQCFGLFVRELAESYRPDRADAFSRGAIIALRSQITRSGLQ